MKYKVKAKLFLWNPEKGSWHFVTIPPELSSELSEKYKKFAGGWGSLPVKVYFENPENKKQKIILETSIFKNKKEKNYFTYILPIKKSVRQELGVQDRDIVEFELEVYAK
jgi:hypothetical protein